MVARVRYYVCSLKGFFFSYQFLHLLLFNFYHCSFQRRKRGIRHIQPIQLWIDVCCVMCEAMKPHKSLFSTTFFFLFGVRMHPGARDHWKTTVVHFRLEFPLKLKVLLEKKGMEMKLGYSISLSQIQIHQIEDPRDHRPNEWNWCVINHQKKLLIDSNALTYDNEFLLQTYMICVWFFFASSAIGRQEIFSVYLWILIKSSPNEKEFVCTINKARLQALNIFSYEIVVSIFCLDCHIYHS